MATVFLQGALVALQNGVDLAPELILRGCGPGAAVVVYDPASIDDPGQLERACRLSRPRVFRTFLLSFFVVFFPALASVSSPLTSSSPIREYQTSSSPSPRTGSSVACRRPRPRVAAIRRIEAVVAAGHHGSRRGA